MSNPDARPAADEVAEEAVRDAIAALVGSGKRAYSLSVPLAAKNLLVARGEGSITHGEANERINDAVAALVTRGDLDARPEGRFDWKIKPKAAPPKNKMGFR
jgi:hypothetical protein